MQAIRFLHRALAQALPSIHSRRLTTLMSCVSSLLQGRRLTLTALGRFMPGQAFPKHAIKRVDRLLGNQHLRAERPLFYWVILRALLGSVKHPLILVDWSRIDAPGSAFLLRAAIPLAWRSFPIYESVHEREGCPKYQNRLLKTLVELLPDGCVPVMVTDAGFRRPWMKAVAAQGWYYVARIRNRELYRGDENEWLPVQNLYALATSSPKSLGRVEMMRSAEHLINLYCVRHSARRERQPWLLASNLRQDGWNPAKIVAIYKRRMQIEEGFRDVKSEHLGLGLNLHRSHCPKRIEVLLLIAALANYLLFLTGLRARERGLERRYQSNSIKEKRVLSLWRLGLEYWRSCANFGGREHLEILERALRDEVRHQAQSLG